MSMRATWIYIVKVKRMRILTGVAGPLQYEKYWRVPFGAHADLYDACMGVYGTLADLFNQE